MLVLASVGFLVNFWAWALISPLAAAYRGELSLSPFQQSLLVAVPVLVGSLGRIPVGALTDKFGARVMFPVVSFLTILPVLFVGLAGDTYTRLLLGGFFLGIGGTAFAVGIPFVNAWFPPARRGLALGLFGIGMGGTAISAFTTVRLADAHGRGKSRTLELAALLGEERRPDRDGQRYREQHQGHGHGHYGYPDHALTHGHIMASSQRHPGGKARPAEKFCRPLAMGVPSANRRIPNVVSVVAVVTTPGIAQSSAPGGLRRPNRITLRGHGYRRETSSAP